MNLAVRGRTRSVGLLVLVFFVCLGLLPGAALAQEGLQVEKLYLAVWPEYYTPDVVVSQAISLVNVSQEPVGGEIWFQLPKTVEPMTLGEVANDITPKYFEVVDKGDHQLLRYELSSPLEPGAKLSLLLEYSYPRFQEAGRREIPVEFVSKYPVKELNVEIKQPLRSTEFTLSPAHEGKAMDSEGFDVYLYSFNDVKPDQKLEFQISYQKEDNLPSLDPEPAAAAVNGESREGSMNSTTVALLVIALLAVLGIVLVLALRGGPRGMQQPPKGKKTGAGKAAAGTGGAKGGRQDKAAAEPMDQRKKLRKMLVEGKINEKTYEKLLAELDKDK